MYAAILGWFFLMICKKLFWLYRAKCVIVSLKKKAENVMNLILKTPKINHIRMWRMFAFNINIKLSSKISLLIEKILDKWSIFFRKQKAINYWKITKISHYWLRNSWDTQDIWENVFSFYEIYNQWKVFVKDW